MTTKFHFISGLPRSGSTLLAAILRQNPDIFASMSTPVGGIFNAVHRAISGTNEAAMFLIDQQREQMLRNVFDAVYNDAVPIVFDTNRMWPAKLPTLVKLFPDCKVVCCVRRVAWIVDSIERLIRSNPFELSGIFGFEAGGSVYTRAAGLCSSNGLIGFALDALREGFYSEHSDRLMLIEYEALAKDPQGSVRAIYDWLGIPWYDGHDFDNIEQIPGAAEFDRKLGTPGLHSVRNKVEWRDRDMILPPELFTSFAAPFWRQNNSKVPVIHWEDEPLREAAE